MAIGKISGPLLKENLLRDGVDLAFETNLIYLDVNNRKVGIKTSSPTHDLTVNGITRTGSLEVTPGFANIGDLTITGNQIYSNTGTLNLSPTVGAQVVYQSKLLIDDIQIEGNMIQTVNSNSNLEFTASGSGTINLNADTEVFGNLHATGTITADGNIQLGDSDTDSITINAEIASNIIPDVHNTYSLGNSDKRWADVWVQNLQAANVTTGAFDIGGIDITLRQGNIYYVALNGNDGNTGTHQNDPLSSVGRALDLAGTGDTIYIYPGTYSETMPLVVPQGVTVKGAGIRSVAIVPDSDLTVDVFLLNGETTVEDLTVKDFRYDVGTNTGYAFRFAPGATVTTRSPYIRNVSVITQGSVTSLSDPRGFLTGDAGKGAYIDGSVVDATSKEATMLFNSATFITPGVDTITATNGVRIEWLNSFTYFADHGIYALSGSTGFAGTGQTRLRIDTRIGTWAVGNTVRYYDTDGTTILASGVIDSIDGNYITLTGKCLGFETITDRTPTTLYAQGGAALSTARYKWGASSLLLDGIGDYVTHPSAPDFGFGADAWCVEAWIYNTTAPGAVQTVFDFRNNATAADSIILNIQTDASLNFYANGGPHITSGSPIPLNTWTHIALACDGTYTRMFVNGTQTGVTYTDTHTYIQGPLTIGARFDGTLGFYGNFDDVKISKGVARYTSNFTAPTLALTGDLDTVLLLHFDGLNGSTIFLDDGITLQDIRNITTGGTASIINFADYSDFGAEIRSISSANVYGDYGVYADGVGVEIILIGHNFGYVGAGRLSSNDPNDAIQDNEVTQLNGSHVHYNSIDHIGNFRVGEYFVVEQETGNITFNVDSLQIQSSAGVTFTDGVNTTIVNPTKIETGNIRISGNTIQSLTGGITLTAANTQVNVTSNLNITGTLDVTENFSVQGNTVIGDSTSDVVTFNSKITSNLIPSGTGLYDIGAVANTWRNVYLSQADVDDIRISGNTITTTVSNSDLELRANGAGIVSIPDDNLVVGQNFTVSGNTTLTNATVTGTITLNNLVVNSTVQSGKLATDDIVIEGNVIRTTLSNSNLELRANGSGAVLFENLSVQGSTISSLVPGQNIEFTPSGSGIFKINSNQALTLPIGSDAQRPLSPQAGMVRFNSTVNQFEGYTGTAWVQFGSVIDADRNTYIVPELSPGSNENTLYFYADGNLAATLNSNQFDVNKLLVDQIEINGNVIRTVTTNTDLELRPNGTGGVIIDDIKINSNTITNTTPGAVTEFRSTGSGYYQITGNNAVVIPAGTDFQRPLTGQVGMMRYSTNLGFVEVHNGTTWISVAGTGSGITADQATEIAIAQVLLFG